MSFEIFLPKYTVKPTENKESSFWIKFIQNPSKDMWCPNTELRNKNLFQIREQIVDRS